MIRVSFGSPAPQASPVLTRPFQHRDGLVEIAIEPPCHTNRGLASMFARSEVNRLILSLVDPDGFVAALEMTGTRKPM